MRIGPEGRVVIPASIRRHLGVSAGDNVRFVLLEDGRVEIVSPRMLAMALWANNTGGDAVDSTDTIRSMREEDQAVAARSDDAQRASTDGPGAVGPDTARLLNALGLRR